MSAIINTYFTFNHSVCNQTVKILFSLMQVDHFENPKLLAAVEELSAPTNTLSIASVAYKHGVEDNLVAAIFAWQDEGPLPPSDGTQQVKALNITSL